MQHATVISGFGGQGLLFAGRVLAEAAMIEGRHVSWMPSYGPEMRGGTASCTVIIADHPIGSPIVDSADSVIALNPPSMAKFEPLLAAGGLLIANSTLIEAEQGAIEHMNSDHRDALNLYATRLLGAADADWLCTGCDPDGIDLQAERMTLRLDFPQRVTGPGELRKMLVKLADEARKKRDAC